jgi:hypothetical protein
LAINSRSPASGALTGCKSLYGSGNCTLISRVQHHSAPDQAAVHLGTIVARDYRWHAQFRGLLDYGGRMGKCEIRSTQECEQRKIGRLSHLAAIESVPLETAGELATLTRYYRVQTPPPGD